MSKQPALLELTELIVADLNHLMRDISELREKMSPVLIATPDTGDAERGYALPPCCLVRQALFEIKERIAAAGREVRDIGEHIDV